MSGAAAARVGLAELVAPSDERLAWLRALALLAALLSRDLVSLVLAPLVIGGRLPGADSLGLLAAAVARAALCAGLALALLRLLPSVPVAVAALALAFAPASRFATWLGLRLADPAHPRPTSALWAPAGLVLTLLWTLLFFGALALALRLIARPGLALLLGATTGQFASSVASLFVHLLRPPGEGVAVVRWELLQLPIALLGAAVFALVLWAGLRLTPAPAAGAPAPGAAAGS